MKDGASQWLKDEILYETGVNRGFLGSSTRSSFNQVAAERLGRPGLGMVPDWRVRGASLIGRMSCRAREKDG